MSVLKLNHLRRSITKSLNEEFIFELSSVLTNKRKSYFRKYQNEC